MNVRILDTSIPSIEIHIRSDDYKFKFSNNDFLFQLHETITNPNEKLYYMSAELTHAEFPVSYFNVSENNNRFDFHYEGADRSTLLTVGNYNMPQLLTHFSSLISAYGFRQKIVIDWGSSNNKLTFTSAKSSGFSLKESSTCLDLLGFTKKQHDSDFKITVNGNNDKLVYQFMGAQVTQMIPHGRYTAEELRVYIMTGINQRGHGLTLGFFYNIVTDKFKFNFQQVINNSFVYLWDGGTTEQTIALAAGNRDPTQIRVEIENAFNAIHGAGALTTAFDSGSGEYTFISDKPLVLKSSSTLLPVLGFTTADHYATVANNIMNYYYDGGNLLTITLTGGTYTRQQLIDHFLELFHAAHGASSLTLEFHHATNFFKFVSDKHLTIKSSSTCLPLFGFSATDFNSTTIEGVSTINTIYSDTVTNYAYVDVHDVHHKIVSNDPVSGAIIYISDHIEKFYLMGTSNIWDLLGFTLIPLGQPAHESTSGEDGHSLDGHTTSAFLGTGTLQSDTMCDIRVYSSLFFHTDLFSNGLSATTQAENNSKNVLARIPVNAGTYATILYTPYYPHNVPLPKKSFKTFRVSVRDDQARIIDMNLMKWTATITIRFHKKNTIASDYQSVNAFTGGFNSSSYMASGSTEHTLISYIKAITEEYKNGNLDYSRLTIT